MQIQRGPQFVPSTSTPACPWAGQVAGERGNTPSAAPRLPGRAGGLGAGGGWQVPGFGPAAASLSFWRKRKEAKKSACKQFLCHADRLRSATRSTDSPAPQAQTGFRLDEWVGPRRTWAAKLTGCAPGLPPHPRPSPPCRGRGSKARCPVRAVPCLAVSRTLSRTRESAGVRAPSAGLINRNPPAPTAAREKSRPGCREEIGARHPGKKSPPCPSPPGGRVRTAWCRSQSARMT